MLLVSIQENPTGRESKISPCKHTIDSLNTECDWLLLTVLNDNIWHSGAEQQQIKPQGVSLSPIIQSQGTGSVTTQRMEGEVTAHRSHQPGRLTVTSYTGRSHRKTPARHVRLEIRKPANITTQPHSSLWNKHSLSSIDLYVLLRAWKDPHLMAWIISLLTPDATGFYFT